MIIRIHKHRSFDFLSILKFTLKIADSHKNYKQKNGKNCHPNSSLFRCCLL